MTGVGKLAEKLGCGKTQVSNILKQKTLVREEYERGFSSAKKHNCTSQYSDVNDAVWEWFKKKTEQRIPVDGPIIQQRNLATPEFKASSGWFTRFKERHNLSQCKLCGESADVPEATVYSWKEPLGSIISGYETQDIWNMDDTGCIYCALLDKSLSEKAKKCKGGKKSKEQLTVAFFISATGERRTTVVIGKYANPRCLKNINNDDLPCQYLNQQKAWMTSDILYKLLGKLNSSFKAQNRSILSHLLSFLQCANYKSDNIALVSPQYNIILKKSIIFYMYIMCTIYNSNFLQILKGPSELNAENLGAQQMK